MGRSSTQPTADASPDAEADVEIVDREVLSQLIEIVGWEEVPQIWKDFQSDTTQLVAQLREALVPHDTAKMAHAAHTLKGLAQMFGIATLTTACEALYRMARSGNLTSAAPLVAQIEHCLPRARAVLARELGQAEPDT